MAITFVGSNTTETASATTVDVPLPASLQENDFVLVLVSHGATTNETFSEGGGTWTKANGADLYSNDTRDNNAGLFYKKMGASPDSTVTITSSSSSSMVALSVAYRGVDTTTPLDTAITTMQTTTNTANVNSPAIVPVTNNCAILTMGGSAGLVSGLTVTAPTNYNDMVQKSHSSQNVTVVSAWRTLATAASENPANYVFSTSDTSSCYNAFTVALRPVSALSATLSKTLDNVTSSATGTISLSGTVSKTLGTLTTTATGTVAIVGTTSKTLDALTLVATGGGTTPVLGEASITLAALTTSATSTLALAATFSKTLDSLTLLATGEEPGAAVTVVVDNFSFGMGLVGKMRVHPHPTHSRIKA